MARARQKLQANCETSVVEIQGTTLFFGYVIMLFLGRAILQVAVAALATMAGYSPKRPKSVPTLGGTIEI